MTLENQLLERLADWRPDSTRSALVVDDHDAGWRVQLTGDAADTLGCRLRSLEVRRLRPLENASPLAEQAAGLASRVTGLLEPLRLVEVDGSRNVAQLRSAAPARTGEELRYYEVLRHDDGTTTLSRYRAGTGQREAIDFTLTHEALGKIVRDFTA